MFKRLFTVAINSHPPGVATWPIPKLLLDRLMQNEENYYGGELRQTSEAPINSNEKQ